MSKTINNTEIEYKLWAGLLTKEDFHDMVQKVQGGRAEPKYVVSCDDYYSINREGYSEDFIRYRKGSGMKELTLKSKRDGNLVRKEINLKMTDNDDSDVVEFLKLSGYKKLFSVFKESWIWTWEHGEISYYTLSDGRSVIEIEATDYDSVDEGKGILKKYAEALGLRRDEEWLYAREKRSLFEIFSQEQ